MLSKLPEHATIDGMAADVQHALKIGFISLGCPKNQLDCELMLARAEDLGCVITPHITEAEVIVVNTCSFIQPAINEARSGIREALRYKAHGRCRLVVVAGCLPQYWGSHVKQEYPQVDAWLTPDNPLGLGEIITRWQNCELTAGVPAGLVELPQFLASAANRRVLSTPPSLAYLKIAEGCNHRCRFCLIPQLRGRYRSRPLEDIVTEFRWLVDQGTPEVVLVSQDSTYYGRDLKNGYRGLAELLAALSQSAQSTWLRVMYLHPDGISTELLQVWQQLGPALLPYFDLPLQHVNPVILQNMGRRGGAQEHSELLAAIREACPQAVIRTSLIVGYPGETEAYFQELLELVETGAFDRVGVFCYSELPEMRSAPLAGKVAEQVKERRRQILMLAQARVAERLGHSLIGMRQEVIIESCEPAPSGSAWLAWGRSWREAYAIDGLVRFKCPVKPLIYRRVMVEITGAAGHDLTARLVEPDALPTGTANP